MTRRFLFVVSEGQVLVWPARRTWSATRTSPDAYRSYVHSLPDAPAVSTGSERFHDGGDRRLGRRKRVKAGVAAQQSRRSGKPSTSSAARRAAIMSQSRRAATVANDGSGPSCVVDIIGSKKERPREAESLKTKPRHHTVVPTSRTIRRVSPPVDLRRFPRVFRTAKDEDITRRQALRAREVRGPASEREKLRHRGHTEGWSSASSAGWTVNTTWTFRRPIQGDEVPVGPRRDVALPVRVGHRPRCLPTTRHHSLWR